MVDTPPVSTRHYTDKKTWWAIIVVAFLSGLGGGFAKSGWAWAQQAWQVYFPPEWHISYLVQNAENRPLANVGIVLMSEDGRTVLTEAKTRENGTAKLSATLEPGVYVMIHRITHRGADYVSTEQLVLKTDRIIPRRLIFDPDAWPQSRPSPPEPRQLKPTIDPQLPVAKPRGAPPEEAIWLATAYAEIGVNEKDQRGQMRIEEYWNAAGFDFGADIPWTSAFPEWVMQQTGRFGPRTPQARKWMEWGRAVETLRPGCIAVLWRRSPDSWQGHVGFYLGQDGEGRLTILSGNSRDSVRISTVSRDRLLGCRWPE